MLREKQKQKRNRNTYVRRWETDSAETLIFNGRFVIIFAAAGNPFRSPASVPLFL